MPFTVTVRDCTTTQVLPDATVGQTCTKKTDSNGQVTFQDCEELAMFSGKQFVKSITGNPAQIPYSATTATYSVVSYGLTSVGKSTGYPSSGTSSVGTACQIKTTDVSFTISANTTSSSRQFCISGSTYTNATVSGCVTQAGKPWCDNIRQGAFKVRTYSNYNCVESGTAHFPSGTGGIFIKPADCDSCDEAACLINFYGSTIQEFQSGSQLYYCQDNQSRRYTVRLDINIIWPDCMPTTCGPGITSKLFTFGIGDNIFDVSKTWWKNEDVWNSDHDYCSHIVAENTIELTAQEIANLEFWFIVGNLTS